MVRLRTRVVVGIWGVWGARGVFVDGDAPRAGDPLLQVLGGCSDFAHCFLERDCLSQDADGPVNVRGGGGVC